jgi:hypothetical protein
MWTGRQVMRCDSGGTLEVQRDEEEGGAHLMLIDDDDDGTSNVFLTRAEVRELVRMLTVGVAHDE